MFTSLSTQISQSPGHNSMHLGIYMWSRRFVEAPTEHQDGEEREFECHVMKNAGWSGVFQKLLILHVGPWRRWATAADAHTRCPLVPTEHRLDTAANLSIVVHRVHPLMTVVNLLMATAHRKMHHVSLYHRHAALPDADAIKARPLRYKPQQLIYSKSLQTISQ